MATNTTNFGLKKPAYYDTADIADINGNMDKVDVSLNGLADAIAIVANNNTHAAITEGQYVYVHGHGSLAEGLYKAKSNIAANATLSTSNLQADGSGGLNALNSKFRIVSSGSLHDITESGIYYLTSSVTDKPVSGGGLYILTVFNEQLRTGKYISLSNEEFNLICNGGNWSLFGICFYKEITATTTATGAVQIPTEIGAARILSAHYTDGKIGQVYKRDRSYFTCVDSNNNPYASTQVKFEIIYLGGTPIAGT